MRKKALLYFSIVMLVILLPQVNAQLFSPAYSIEATVSDGSIVIGCGKTSFMGNLTGVNISDLIDVSSFDFPEEVDNYTDIDEKFHLEIIKTVHGFPLFSRTVISGVMHAALMSKSMFDNSMQTPQDVQRFLNQIEEFPQVSIIIDQGMVFLGTDGSKLNIESAFDFALSGLFEIPFQTNQTIDVTGIISSSPQMMSYTKNTSLVFPFLNSTKITIVDSENNTIRSVSGMDYFLIMNHNILTIKEDSSVHLFPASSKNRNTDAILSISPAEDQDVDFTQLISELSSFSEFSDELSLPVNFSNDGMITYLISSVSPVLNGGLIFANTTHSLHIDGESQPVSFFAFLRGDLFTIKQSDSDSSAKQIKGQASVMFIDDHFFTVDGKNNEYGLFLPIFPFLFWIAAIICFVLWNWYLPKKEDPMIDKKTSYILLSIRLLTIIIIFVLIDVTINARIGISFFSLASSHLFSLLTLGFLIFQLVLWVLGYLCCAFPLQYVFYTLFRFTPLDDFGKTPSKCVGLLGIWIFSILYMILLLNIALFFISPMIPSMPMG